MTSKGDYFIHVVLAEKNYSPEIEQRKIVHIKAKMIFAASLFQPLGWKVKPIAPDNRLKITRMIYTALKIYIPHGIGKTGFFKTNG